jgi:hypothetical protein
MSTTKKTHPTCRFCGRGIEGISSPECVWCYAARYRPCPVCRDSKGKKRPKYKNGGCARCGDKGWIMLEEPPKTSPPVETASVSLADINPRWLGGGEP